MKPVLTADEYRRVDRDFTGDLNRVMNDAGHAVALAAVRAGAGYGRRVAVLAGPGNNGGDGYVAARYLRDRGAHVSIHAHGEPRTVEARSAAARIIGLGVPVRAIGSVTDVDVVVDALFGGGVRDGLAEDVVAWMHVDAPVVAVDFPTGLDPNTGWVAGESFMAVETVTFGSLKTGHVLGVGPDRCGRVTVADIGIAGGTPCLYVLEEADAPRPTRPRRSHKWSAGAVLVAGGSTGLVGASVLAGRSALAFGAGAVVVASPRSDLVGHVSPELPSISPAVATETLDRFDVVVIGPGLAAGDMAGILPIAVKAKRVVLDAGGLTPELLDAALGGGGKVIVTPHDGEFERVAGVRPGTYAVRAFAKRKGVTVVRKGNPTMISDGGPPMLVASAGRELATIGTGDVLSGMIAALWARGLEATSAAISGAHWHGVAGESLSRSGTVTADRLVEHVRGFAW